MANLLVVAFLKTTLRKFWNPAIPSSNHQPNFIPFSRSSLELNIDWRKCWILLWEVAPLSMHFHYQIINQVHFCLCRDSMMIHHMDEAIENLVAVFMKYFSSVGEKYPSFMGLLSVILSPHQPYYKFSSQI